MGARLYVGNLNYRTTVDGLRAAIEARGRKVKDIAVISDKETGQSKGFAFVELLVDGELAAAIQELNGLEVDGRPLRVSEAHERAAKPTRPGGGFDRGPRPGGDRGGERGGRGGYRERDEGGGGGGGGWGGRRSERY